MGLFIICAPFGAGKSTIVNELISLDPRVKRSIPFSTRDKHKREVEGVDYFFKSKKVFLEMIERKEFLEHTMHPRGYDGTPLASVLDGLARGHDIVLEVERVNVDAVREKLRDQVTFIFISVPPEVLRYRLINGKDMDIQKLERRLAISREEANHLEKFDHVILNDRTPLEAAQKILEIIQAKRKPNSHQ